MNCICRVINCTGRVTISTCWVSKCMHRVTNCTVGKPN
jgi:hypothetical protein